MKSELEDIWTNAGLTIEQGTDVISAYTKLLDAIKKHKDVPVAVIKKTENKSNEGHPLDTLMKYIGT